MAVVQEFDLNIIPDSAPVIVHVDQFDTGEGRLKAKLYNGDTPYSPVGASAMIQGTKPDGTFYMYSAEISGNVVTANLEKVMTQVPGRVRTQFVITDDENRTGTFVFWLEVQVTALEAGGSSESIIEYIEEAIEETQENALESEAWAVGKRDGTDVPSTDPAYHNNSKYYAGEAATSESNAATSESNASASEQAAAASEENAEAWAVGKRDGTDVPSTDPTYHNNSKYYAGEASTSATNASNSEQAAATSEDNAEAWAVGKKDGTDVPSTDPAYHNNSKYYAGEASTSATNASNSESAASDSAEDSEAWAVGERNGSPVEPTDPTYHNNAKYYAEQMGLPSLAGLTDVELTSLADDNILEYDSNSSKWKNTSGGMTGATAGAAGGRGFVPAPAAGDQNKVLNGDGTWKALPTMTGASAGSGGTSGIIPAPSSGDQDKVLKGDGTWGTGGHTILNESGSTMTAEDKLQFSSKVADDNVNGKTIVYSGSEEVVTVPHTSWTTQNTTIDGTVYPYKKAITLTKPIYGSPVIDRVATVGGSTTDAQITAFNCLAYVGHDPDYPTTLNLYASSVPAVDFSILVRWEGGEA